MLISFTPIQDGVTGVAASATNTPLQTIYNDYNGNITDANIASSAAIAFSKVAGGTASALGAYLSYTPSLVGITVGNGVIVGKYIQIGKHVHCYGSLTFGSSTSVTGTTTISLPVSASANYISDDSTIGQIGFIDTGNASYAGGIRVANSTTVRVLVWVANGTFLTDSGLSSVQPFTWGTGDVLTWTGYFEAA